MLAWVVALAILGVVIYFMMLYLPGKSSHETIAADAPVPATTGNTATETADQASGYFAAARYNLDSLADNPEGRSIRYGHDLISETYKYLGPEVKVEAMRYAGNNLSCKNCHLQAGQKKFAAPYVGIWGIYPTYKGREDAISTIEERINGCMERSLAGKPLPLDSKEMEAMVMYIKWLGKDIPVGRKMEGQGFVKISFPERAADLVQGKAVYVPKCASCHGPDGQGRRNGAPGSATGYTYPPLWGPDSYNDGAGMHRLMTAARFIKANMPFGATAGNPILTDEEAYDVAAYINSFPRPEKAHKEKDYPDLSKKPVDSPYPPYADTFPAKQHQFGPFQPIEALRKAPAGK